MRDFMNREVFADVSVLGFSHEGPSSWIEFDKEAMVALWQHVAGAVGN